MIEVRKKRGRGLKSLFLVTLFDDLRGFV